MSMEHTIRFRVDTESKDRILTSVSRIAQLEGLPKTANGKSAGLRSVLIFLIEDYEEGLKTRKGR